MGQIINRRRVVSKVDDKPKEKVLFELYDANFDGTVNSVVDTDVALWDGTHNKFRMEIVYKRSGTTSLQGLFTCKPDTSPYSGIRYRRGASGSGYEVVTISESITILSNDGFSTNGDTYGNHFFYDGAYDKEYTFILTRDDNYMKGELDGHVFECTMNNVKTNNLHLLIGCDYKSTGQTQRYFQGVISKFIITEPI